MTQNNVSKLPHIYLRNGNVFSQEIHEFMNISQTKRQFKGMLSMSWSTDKDKFASSCAVGNATENGIVQKTPTKRQ